MKLDRRRLLATLLPGLVLVIWTGLVLALVGATLADTEQAALGALLESRAALVLLLGLVLAGGLGWGVSQLYRDRVEAPARLLEEAQILLAGDVHRELGAQGSAENRGLTRAINDLAAQREQLRRDVEARVREASHRIEQEKSRLAALMSELTQSVVVCSLDGRVILYNNRARMQFRALSEAPAVAGGAELMGLGRSIYTVFDRKLIAHALESVQQRMQRGAASPSAQFVTTTRAGQLLRVQMTPVRASTVDGDSPAITGFVLMLDNITRQLEDESARDRLLHGLTEGSRSSLANMQAALDMLEYPDLDTAMRERFQAVIRGRDRRHEPAHPGPCGQFGRWAQDPLAHGRHAGHRLGGGRLAADRGGPPVTLQCRGSGCIPVAPGRQLFPAASPGVSRGSAGG
ncbi:hypothetical protein LP417_19755 [Polaromonas sp. P1-6]|nr:hypothetical protein LP417_19755 [Polaromonas sp. P1-6]